MSPIAIVALGGNALITDAEHEAIPNQYDAVRSVADPLVELVEQGWGLVVSHGNGPQVGFIMRRSELSQGELSPVPMDYAVADTQGAIGYMFLKAIGNALRRKGLQRPVVAIVTQTIVDPADPAFAHPSKPVGSFMDEPTARERAAAAGLAGGRGRGPRLAPRRGVPDAGRDRRARHDSRARAGGGDRRRRRRRRHPRHAR